MEYIKNTQRKQKKKQRKQNGTKRNYLKTITVSCYIEVIFEHHIAPHERKYITHIQLALSQFGCFE